MRAIYHDWIKDNEEIVGKNPALSRVLSERVVLELYTGPKGNDPHGYAQAVIAVYGKNWVYRSKYDSGPVEDDLEGMANDCEGYIRTMFGLQHFIDQAEEQYRRYTPWWRRLIEGG
jgi:hypothetical protein